MPENYATNTTHLMWVGRWIEVRWTADGWLFKRGRDAADYLLHPPPSRPPLSPQ